MDSKVILLVEDNPDDEELTLRAFRQSGIANEIVVARDGAEALDYLFGGSAIGGGIPRERVAVVLLDLKLPKVDGLEVLRRMRGERATELIPVVVLTSSNEEQDLVASYRFGCNSYVRKPVSFTQFVSATHQIGLYWLLLNELPPVN